MRDAEHVAGFVNGGLQRAPQAEAIRRVTRARIAVAMQRPDADSIAQRGLTEDPVEVSRPKVTRDQPNHSNRILRTLWLEDVVQDPRRENLLLVVSHSASRLRDVTQRPGLQRLNRHAEEVSHELGRLLDETLLSLIELAERLDVDRLVLVLQRPAGQGLNVLPEGLTALGKAFEPIARLVRLLFLMQRPDEFDLREQRLETGGQRDLDPKARNTVLQPILIPPHRAIHDGSQQQQ